jgi:PhoH-like ATPase
MAKTYVLDTNVLIQSPVSLLSFEENTVVLPIVCLEELDKLKTEDGEYGANARECIRFLESLRQNGNLLEGVALACGGMLRIEPNYVHVPLREDFSDTKNDNRILKVCRGLMENGEPVILVTKDIIVRLKAQMMGIPAEDFTTEQSPHPAKQYGGRADVYMPEDKFSTFKKRGISPDDLYAYKDDRLSPLCPVLNQFFVLHSDMNDKKTLLGRYNGKIVAPLEYSKREPTAMKRSAIGVKKSCAVKSTSSLTAGPSPRRP